MALYVQQTWTDNNVSFPVSAARMQHIEAGIAAAVPADSVALLSGRVLQNMLLGTDAQPAFILTGDGKIQWGAGGSSAPDANLYRYAAGQLATDGQLRVRLNASTALILEGAAGGLTIGGDTTLYRAAANSLKTDGTFRAGSDAIVQDGLGGQAKIGARGPAAQPGISLGSSDDTNLYRSASAALKTDGSFHVAFDLFVREGAASQLLLGLVGSGAGIYFGSAFDANLYRSAANVLKTDGVLNAVGGLQVNSVPVMQELAVAGLTNSVQQQVSLGTETAPTDLVTFPAFTADGTMAIAIETAGGVFGLTSGFAIGDTVGFSLWEGSTDLGRLWGGFGFENTQSCLFWPTVRSARFVPTAGSHTYKLRGWHVGSGTASFYYHDGGLGSSASQHNPAFSARIVRLA